METPQSNPIQPEIERDLRRLLNDLPRRDQFAVLCVVHFLYLRSHRGLLSTNPRNQNRFTLLWMVVNGAWNYYTYKLRVAMSG